MTGWTAVVPVKRWALSKSRMAGGVHAREALARAFAFDVVETLSEVASIDTIVIVTGEGEMAALGRRSGATVLPDYALLSVDPLNDAIRRARSYATTNRPASPIVVVPADLPAMSAASMERALQTLGACASAFVPDTGGSGTTLLAASHPRRLQPMYGPGSARLHHEHGAQAVADVDGGLRRDVDTVEHLQEAERLGLAPRTAGVVAHLLEAAARPRLASAGR